MDKVVLEEYLMHKLEPREDVLSPVISKAMSPKRAPGDMGVVWGMLWLTPTWRIVQIHSYWVQLETEHCPC